MSERRYQPGDRVRVLSLGKTGEVVEALRQESCRIAFGSLTMVVSSRDLQLEDTPARSNERQRVKVIAASKAARVGTTLDLHGMTVAEAVTQLESWLNACILARHGNVKVIHGLGTGRVQRAVHEVLQRYSAIRAFRINDLNPGETDVFLETTGTSYG